MNAVQNVDGQVHDPINIPEFMGTWYVIAHIPYWAERNKLAGRDVYTLRADGRIDNEYRFKKAFDQPDKSWSGVSEIVPGSGGRRWRVQFVWPFKTEMQILYVDSNYQHAVLATPDRKLAWVFSRKPQISPAIKQALQAKLEAAGVVIEDMQDVPQLPPSSD